MNKNNDIKVISRQIGQNIKKYRSDNNYTQVSLANELNFKDYKIQRLEQGRFSTLDLKVLINLCSKFDIEISSLFSGTEFIKKFDKDTIQKYQSLPKEKQTIIELTINLLYNKENNIISSNYLNEQKLKLIGEILNI